MTSHSLVPKAARQVGIDFEELCWRILETMPHGGGAAHERAAAHRSPGCWRSRWSRCRWWRVLNGWIGGERWPMRHLRVHRRVPPGQRPSACARWCCRSCSSGFFAVRPASDARRQSARCRGWSASKCASAGRTVLEVSLVEHRPFARWGDDRLLSEHGELFPAPKELPAGDLPLFDGPDARAADVIALYNAGARRCSRRPGWQVRGVQPGRARQLDRCCCPTAPKSRSAATTRSTRLQRFARLLPQLRRPAAAPTRARRPALHQRLRAGLGRRPPAAAAADERRSNAGQAHESQG